MAMYALFVVGGESLVCHAVKADTVNRYSNDAAALCKPWHLVSFFINEFCARSGWIKTVLDKHERWNKMPNRQKPVTNDMIE